MMTPAERQRRRRKRQKAGRGVLPIEVDLYDIEAKLCAAGFLPPYGTDDRDELARALALAVASWKVTSVTRDNSDI